MRRETYLDWNATAPLRPHAAAAMTAAFNQCGNPSSVHRWGRTARHQVERAREAVAALVGGPPDGVVFTSGGTEANHLALLGTDCTRTFVSSVEHGSVLQANAKARRIPVDRDGIVDLAWLDAALAENQEPALVSGPVLPGPWPERSLTSRAPAAAWATDRLLSPGWFRSPE